MRLLSLLVLLAPVAHADTRSDLIATLRGFSGDAPLTARVEVAVADISDETAKSAPADSTGTALVSMGPDGLSIRWSRDQLDTTTEGAVAEDGPRSGSLRAIESLSVSRLTGYLNAAPDIVRVLEEAVVTGEQDATWGGRPVRLVTLKVTPKLDEKSRKYVKDLEAGAKLWLDSDGVPVAAERRVHVRGRAMLVISFESTETESYEFSRVADRLVVTQHTKETRGSGAGESTQRKATARLMLDPPAG